LRKNNPIFKKEKEKRYPFHSTMTATRDDIPLPWRKCITTIAGRLYWRQPDKWMWVLIEDSKPLPGSPEWIAAEGLSEPITKTFGLMYLHEYPKHIVKFINQQMEKVDEISENFEELEEKKVKYERRSAIHFAEARVLREEGKSLKAQATMIKGALYNDLVANFAEIEKIHAALAILTIQVKNRTLKNFEMKMSIDKILSQQKTLRKMIRQFKKGV